MNFSLSANMSGFCSDSRKLAHFSKQGDQIDILISKNQALQMLCLKHHVAI